MQRPSETVLSYMTRDFLNAAVHAAGAKAGAWELECCGRQLMLRPRFGKTASDDFWINFVRLPKQAPFHASSNDQRLPGDMPREIVGRKEHCGMSDVLRAG